MQEAERQDRKQLKVKRFYVIKHPTLEGILLSHWQKREKCCTLFFSYFQIMILFSNAAAKIVGL